MIQHGLFTRLQIQASELEVQCIATDSNNAKWIGTTNGGMAKLEDSVSGGVKWTIYNTGNSAMPTNSLRKLAIDNRAEMDRLNSYGLICFVDTGARGSGQYWSTSNSGIPADQIWALTIDSSGAKWFGTKAGITKLKV